VNGNDPGRGGPREEPNRVLGFPVRNAGWSSGGRSSGAASSGGRSSGGEEQQHVMGMPADWFESADLGPLRWLAHPVQGYRRWTQRQSEKKQRAD
jgi:hypothetical protein